MKEKLRGMKTSEKLAYIWEYYKLWIIGFLALILLLSSFVKAFLSPTGYWLYGMFVNANVQTAKTAQLKEDVIRDLGFDTKERSVEMTDGFFFDPSKDGGTNNSYFPAFVAVQESGDLDFVTLSKAGIQKLGETHRLMPLDSEGCENVLEKYKDRLVYATDPDSGKEYPFGINLSDSKLVTSYHLYEGDCVLGINALCTHIDAVEQFLKFVM